MWNSLMTTLTLFSLFWSGFLQHHPPQVLTAHNVTDYPASSIFNNTNVSFTTTPSSAKEETEDTMMTTTPSLNLPVPSDFLPTPPAITRSTFVVGATASPASAASVASSSSPLQSSRLSSSLSSEEVSASATPTTLVNYKNLSLPLTTATESLVKKNEITSNFVEFAAEKDSPFPGDPSICGNQCPPYAVVESRQQYEVRSYPSSAWVSTFLFGENRVLAELEGYTRLKKYMDGNNDQGISLNMTVPLVTQIKYRNNPGVRREIKDYTMTLYLPYSGKHSEPPYPVTNDVLIDRVEPRLVFVHRFKSLLWEMTDRHVRAKASKFMELLRNTGEAFLNKYFYLASYNRPNLFNTTTYELWIFASRFRDANHLHPRVKALDPPLNKITLKTIKRICRGLECPRFDVLRVYKYGIQKRRYFDTKFASYSPDDCDLTTTGLWRGFMPLHLYKHGLNSHLEILEATRPIGIVHVKEKGKEKAGTLFSAMAAAVSGRNKRMKCSQNYTVSFYLPDRLHSNPPVTGPLGPQIRVTSLDDTIMYVHTVGGYILDPDRIRAELKRFSRRLREFGLCYREGEYFVVVYDFVVRFHGRLNEIWLLAKPCEQRKDEQRKDIHHRQHHEEDSR